jgi:hypothetical protein
MHRWDAYRLAGDGFLMAVVDRFRSIVRATTSKRYPGLHKMPSSDNFFHYAAEDVGETKVTASVAVGEPLVIDSHQMQYRGMQIVSGDRILNSFETELIGCPINRSSLDASTRHPKRKAPMIVIAALSGT